MNQVSFLWALGQQQKLTGALNLTTTCKFNQVNFLQNLWNALYLKNWKSLSFFYFTVKFLCAMWNVICKFSHIFVFRSFWFGIGILFDTSKATCQFRLLKHCDLYYLSVRLLHSWFLSLKKVFYVSCWTTVFFSNCFICIVRVLQWLCTLM